jgi:hypothetical protein
MKNVLIVLLAVAMAVMSYLYFSEKGKTVAADTEESLKGAESFTAITTRLDRDTAMAMIKRANASPQGMNAHMFKSVWLNRAVLSYVRTHLNLNGMRVYIAKYRDDDAHNPGKLTVILSPTKKPTALTGDGDDTEYFNYGNLCPTRCPDEVPVIDTTRKQ